MSSRDRRRRYQTLISYGLGLSLLVGMLIHFAREGDLWARAARLTAGTVAICWLGAVLSVLSLAAVQLLMTRSLGVRLSYWESAALGVVHRGGNAFTPFRAGTVYRASYLDAVHGMPLARYGSLLVGNHVLVFLAACLAGAVALIALWLQQGRTSAPLLALALVGTVLAVAGAALAREVRWRGGWLVSRLAVLVNGVHALSQDRTGLGAIVSIRLLVLATYAALYRAVLVALDADPGPWVCLLLAVTATWISLVPLVPGGLGLVELVVALTGGAFAVPPAAGFAAVLLLRLGLGSLLALLVVPSWLLLRRAERRAAGAPPAAATAPSVPP